MQTIPIRQFKRVTVEQKQREIRIRRCKQAAVCLALLLACFGLVSIARACFKSRAIPVAQTPAQWPTETSIIKSDKGPTMVMFVEPDSRTATASMNELRRVVMDKEIHAVVVIRRPDSTNEPFRNEPLIQAASQLPNTTIVVDHTGNEGQRFQVRESGQCFLYDQAGRLQFEGQIVSNATSSATPQIDRQEIDFILAGHHRKIDQQRSAGSSAVE